MRAATHHDITQRRAGYRITLCANEISSRDAVGIQSYLSRLLRKTLLHLREMVEEDLVLDDA